MVFIFVLFPAHKNELHARMLSSAELNDCG